MRLTSLFLSLFRPSLTVYLDLPDEGIAPQTHETAKSLLLDIIVREPISPVRRATADVVSVIAKHTVPQGEWNQLLEFLYQCSSSDSKEHREVALMLFASLTETIGAPPVLLVRLLSTRDAQPFTPNLPSSSGDVLRPHFQTLQGIFARGLQDQEESVRVAALKVLSTNSLLPHPEPLPISPPSPSSPLAAQPIATPLSQQMRNLNPLQLCSSAMLTFPGPLCPAVYVPGPSLFLCPSLHCVTPSPLIGCAPSGSRSTGRANRE